MRCMQRPSAHIATQGNAATSTGAMPAATSQLQLKASPVTTAIPARTKKPRRPPR